MLSLTPTRGRRENSHNLCSALGKAHIVQAAGALSLAFEPNRGQTDPRVKYLARARGYTAFLAGNETVFLVKGAKNSVVIMSFPNASAASQVVASDMQVGKTNYLSGNEIFSGGSNDAVFPFGGLTGCTAGLAGIYSSEPVGSCDIPAVGDWDFDGTAKVGSVRAAPGTSQPFLWILDTTGARAYVASGNSASEVFPFGGILGDVPIVGDWLNYGADAFTGVVRAGFLWIEQIPGQPVVFPFGGFPGDQPVVGRWR